LDASLTLWFVPLQSLSFSQAATAPGQLIPGVAQSNSGNSLICCSVAGGQSISGEFTLCVGPTPTAVTQPGAGRYEMVDLLIDTATQQGISAAANGSWAYPFFAGDGGNAISLMQFPIVQAS
jgi:hypothetical protein